MRYNIKDLTGQKFGKLTVLEKTDKRQDGGSVVWKCKCDCGNICEISSKRLRNNINISCGCYQKERQKYSMSNLQKRQQINGTNIDLISKKDANINNKTGVRGVCYITSRHKYKAYLSYNKKFYHLGFYDNINDAIKARKKAEDEYFKTILNTYKK